MKSVYLDNAATTQIRDEVVDKMFKIAKINYGNPSSTHSFGRGSRTLVESSRKQIANHLNVSPSEIIFMSGGTEADNCILRSAVRDLGVKHLISSKIEHHAVTHTLDQLAIDYPIKISYVKLDELGNIDYDDLELILKSSNSKTLVTLMHINNELGNILDINLVSNLCIQYKSLFHSDTVQSVGHYKLDLSSLNIDFLVASAHKFHGPKGIGFAFIRKNSGLKPLIVGGQQERGLRAGTESVYAIAGLNKALQISYSNLEKEMKYIKSIKNYFKDRLLQEIPNSKLNGYCGDDSLSTYTLLNVLLPMKPEIGTMLLFQLDLKGIACSKGSACQSGSLGGSHVLAEILSEEDMQKPSLRFSFSTFNTKEEVDYVIETLKGIIQS